MATTDTSRRLETLRTRGADLAARLMHLDTEIGQAAGADDDPLLSQLLAERSTLQAKIEACSRSIAAARSELSEEGRAERRAQIEAVEAQARAALEQDADDAGHIEALLDDLSETLTRMHARGAEVRRAVHPLLPRGPEGVRLDGSILGDLDHGAGTLGRLIQSEMVRRGLFRDLAPTVDAWPRRPGDVTLAGHYRDRIDRQARRVGHVIDQALAGV